MRIPGRSQHLLSHDSDTMTPMIDVVFLLLVFFICASVGGTADQLLPAELKGSSGSTEVVQPEKPPEEWEHPAIQIRLEPGENGISVLLDEQLLSGTDMLTDRLTRLAAVDPESRIILNIHDDVQVQQFISVYDLCQTLKFQNISFAVTAPTASP
jgi:biopolymer transport protein ExbD